MELSDFHFSQDWIQIRRKLEKKGLSLNQLRSIEDEALLLMTDQGDRLGSEVLACIHEKRDFLIHQALLKNASDGICNILKMRMMYCDVLREQWEGSFASEGKKRGSKRVRESLEFSLQEPLAREFDAQSIESTFSSRMGRIAKMIRQQHSLDPYKNNLNNVQKREVSQIAGSLVSPEVLAHAVDKYVGKLRQQIKVAESFYFGRMKEGMEGLSKLSSQVRQRVDEIVWQVSQEGEVSPEIVIAAILHSVEEQMGMHEDVA